MEQIINMSNQLIAVIVNVIFFLVIYGTIFYILGVIIIGIVKTVYDKFSTPGGRESLCRPFGGTT